VTLSEIFAFHALQATATPTGTNVGGTDLVGEALTRTEFSDADIAYSVLVADAGTDTASLMVASGVLSGTADTQTDGDGKDFEGVTLPTLATLYAVQFVGIAGTTTVVCSDAKVGGGEVAVNANLLWTAPAGLAIGSGTITITPNASTIEITIIGKA
tara:strand:+ start:3437 stop:3907 length:471 start_codon:yes stop_codon:yes gene_type:complete